MADMEDAFRAIRGTWLKMKDAAIEGKKDFAKEAEQCMRFFNGPYDFLYDGRNRYFIFQGQGNLPKPSIAMTVNKIAEGVQLFGPALYHTNPTRSCKPRNPPQLPAELFGDMNDPQVQMQVGPILQQMNSQALNAKVRSALVEAVLNYLPDANDLETESRMSIDEAIIKGLGVVWTDAHKPPGSSRKSVISTYDSQDNLLLDPDQDRRSDCKWAMRRCVKPVWEVEAEYGHEPGSMKGNITSSENQAAWGQVQNDYLRKVGKSNDLMVYWKIWSKMGMGSLLKGIVTDSAEADRFGRYVHLVVADNYPFLINCPRTIWENEEEMARRLQWETPFWRLTRNGWPFSDLVFHEVPGRMWPMSHFKPALGELMFINWAYSFMISKIERTSRDFIAYAKGVEEEMKDAIINGGDLTLIPLAHAMGKRIEDVVSFLQHPPMNVDIYKIVAAVEHNFEQRTGLSELMYGASSASFRSAEEANVKQNNVQIRPDDMAKKVEVWSGNVAVKEALALKVHLDGIPDISAVYGDTIGQLWDKFVASADIDDFLDQADFTIEEGSAKKPNKQRDEDNANKVMQTLMPLFMNWAEGTGDIGPVNAAIQEFCAALNIDGSKFKLNPPPPPPEEPPPPDPAMEQQQGMQQKDAGHKQDLKHRAEKHKVDMAIKKQKKAAASNGKK